MTNKINANKNTLKIKDILKNLQSDSFFYILFISTLLTSIPTPAIALGSSTLPGGLISILLSIQLILGFKHFYLPEFLLNIKIKKSIINKTNKYIGKLQKKKGDYKFFNLKIIDKISGLIIFLNGILMCIPLIFTNWHPSLSTSFISLAHIIKNKKLLQIFYFLSIFMFIGFALLFYIIFKVINKYSNNVAFSQIIKDSNISKLFYTLSFFFICGTLFFFFIFFKLSHYASKKMYTKLSEK